MPSKKKPEQSKDQPQQDPKQKTKDMIALVLDAAQQILQLDDRVTPEIALQHAVDLVKSGHDSNEKQADRDHQSNLQKDAQVGAEKLVAMKPKPSSGEK